MVMKILACCNKLLRLRFARWVKKDFEAEHLLNCTIETVKADQFPTVDEGKENATLVKSRV
nr:hypothetical protein Itr_chr05CG13730 [Ipomoea trifida]GLL27310.1 hypothetical protein Itr_chr05CG13750 [Ipomoea trifida]GLL34960.1 hypothetical protein Itr_chr09CG06060 [Ipomoea trifida]